MLKEVGAKEIMDLYAEIPEPLLLKDRMNLPKPLLDEFSMRRHVEGLLKKNVNCGEYLNFLGAGCAQHFVPTVYDGMQAAATSLCKFRPLTNLFLRHGTY